MIRLVTIPSITDDYAAMQDAIDDGTVWTSPFAGDALALIEAGLCQPNPATWRAQQDAMFDQQLRRQRYEDDEQAAAIISHKRGSR